MDLRRPGPFALFILVAHVLCRFLGVAAHEVLGHTVVALAEGGSAYGLYVSPGSGFTYVYLPSALPVAGVVAMQAAGIAVECLLGLLVWWRTRRSPSFAWRAFGLVVASVFVVYSLLYMAAGAFDFFPGDTWGIVSAVGDPLLAVGFLVAGGVWTLLAGTFMSLGVVRLFQDGGPDLGRDSLMLILYWLVPAPLAFLPGFAASTLLGDSLPATVAMFIALAAVVLAFVVYAERLPAPPARPAKGISWRPIAAAALPLLFIVPVWVGVFGVTADGAKGVLLETPPIQAEGSWLGTLGVNLRVVVGNDFSVRVDWKFRGTFAPTSPLQAQVVASFENRMDHDLYDALARTYVGIAMNESDWDVLSTGIEPGETVWSQNAVYPDARVVSMAPGAYNRHTYIENVTNGTFVDTVLTVYDPYKYRPLLAGEGWLDSLQVVWGDRVFPVGFTVVGGLGPTRITSANYVTWESFNGFQAPIIYRIAFRSL